MSNSGYYCVSEIMWRPAYEAETILANKLSIRILSLRDNEKTISW